ncbi:MAG: tRNA (adenosine(37)-N6)-threonylcarbamoyltransferase complex dimerization subunit type 1 TsaB [Spirochaetales bacterium]|jgi:tRNA threonylcarbamoyl adenosine modification protein YeaZ|nr:tRNA (adenosine(37)-N6)-threonylcarbamoyltransferase complex dimerization subunit type 1 TsaB [Exilispira sp.]NMC66971.1 tRNA (adenosine(37)-N6)-threonylcarbamoyltransferase complex dimerization subunit type 1 TsaB [Spirochaetales bacterium]
MNILLLDTSTSSFHLTIKTSDTFATFTSKTPFDHTEHILLIIDSTLSTLHLKINSIDYVFIGTGPGSFTGIRIAHSIIKGLFFNSNIKILPLPSISLLAYSFFININLFINTFDYLKILGKNYYTLYSMIFGKKNRYYFSKYGFSQDFIEKPLNDIDIDQLINPKIEDLAFDRIKEIIKLEEKLESKPILILDDLQNFPQIEKHHFTIFESKINGIEIINFIEKNIEKFERYIISPDLLLPLYIRKSDAEENIER